jgi:hypothetical protein
VDNRADRIPIFIGALDLTVVSAVLPHVIYDLELPIQTQLDKAAWIVTGYSWPTASP